MTTMSDLPEWAWRLVAAVERYEYAHTQVTDHDDWRCLGKALAAVPDEVRVAAGLAESWTRGRAEEVDVSGFGELPGSRTVPGRDWLSGTPEDLRGG